MTAEDTSARAFTQVLDLLYDADLDRIRGLNSPLDYYLRLDLLVERWDNKLRAPFEAWAETPSELNRLEAEKLAEQIPAWLASAPEVIMAPTPQDPKYNRVNSAHATLTPRWTRSSRYYFVRRRGPSHGSTVLATVKTVR